MRLCPAAICDRGLRIIEIRRAPSHGWPISPAGSSPSCLKPIAGASLVFLGKPKLHGQSIIATAGACILPIVLRNLLT